MKTNVIIPAHNEKNETKIQVAQVVELGKVTSLTLGDGHQSVENNWRSRGGIVFSNNNAIELGKATNLTLGVGARKSEGKRPFGCWKNTK